MREIFGALAWALIPLASAACIPDVPRALLEDAAVLQHPAVTAALEAVKQILVTTAGTTGDSFSVGIAHASSPEGPIMTFNNGRVKMNETGTAGSSELPVTSDSIFRILSTSKNFAAFSTLVVQQESRLAAAAPGGNTTLPGLTLDTPVRAVLPNFHLPAPDWDNGGSEITLAMLGSHSSGLPREGYSTDFNMVTAMAKVTADGIGADWAGVGPENILAFLGTRDLMFAPGQRAAYSNAGFAVLGYAAISHHNQLKGTALSWSEYMNSDILPTLNMTHSFLGAIPPDLASAVLVPAAGADSWADLVLNGYDAAAGMWSSVNDLVKYLNTVWLAGTPALITPTQQRQSLQPRLKLPDGVQQVGFGWEIVGAETVEGDVSGQNKSYNIYGKAGDGGGYHSWIDVVPNLGYGLAILSAEGPVTTNTSITTVSPTGLRDAVHAPLLPAMAAALADRLSARFAGDYADGTDTGLIIDQVPSNMSSSSSSATSSYARLEVADGALFVRELVINGTSALEAIDRLSWTDSYSGRFFSTAAGASLNPSEGAAAAVGYGGGGGTVFVWRMIPEFATCDWFDFDGYTDQNGWPLSKIVLVEEESGEVVLRYPPFDIELRRAPTRRTIQHKLLHVYAKSMRDTDPEIEERNKALPHDIDRGSPGF